MNLAICIPFWRNFECLRTMLGGVWTHSGTSVRFFVHCDDPEEEVMVNALMSQKFPVTVVSRGPIYKDMSDRLNALFNATEFYDWAVFTEQDVFLYHNLSDIIRQLNEHGICMAGPMDTLFHDNVNAIGKPKYGTYARLCPEPGYFHSSLIFLKRSHIGQDKKPFTMPEGFRLHGYGVLGGEPYYGLGVNHGKDKSKLAFFRQLHSSYGYSADIYWGQQFLATHLYYSSTKQGYRKDGFMSEDEYQWLCAEEQRFLSDYRKTTTIAGT